MLSTGPWLGELFYVYDMVKGFRQVFRLFGIELGKRPTAEEIQWLLDLVETQEILKTASPEIAATLRLDGSAPVDHHVPDLLQGTGLLGQASLRTVRSGHMSYKPKGSVIVLLMGGAAQDMDSEIELMNRASLEIGMVVAVASAARQCNSAAEINHPAVQAFLYREGRFPYEWELQAELLQQAGHQAFGTVHVAIDLEDNLIEFANRRGTGGADIVALARAPNTYKLLLARRIIRHRWPKFDAKDDQFWFRQGPSRLATSPKLAADPSKYTSPLEILPALVKLVKELYLLNGGVWDV